jgi:hypothetical protein
LLLPHIILTALIAEKGDGIGRFEATTKRSHLLRKKTWMERKRGNGWRERESEYGSLLPWVTELRQHAMRVAANVFRQPASPTRQMIH